ncbi:MAG: hypothetical protein KAT78_00975 [Flavobacteriaceae bacterium]|nr:hypothetical protein [Flavobacteriaceae bacterium]
MKKTNLESVKNSILKTKKTKLISLNSNDLLHAEIEYEKYYNRIRLLSRGV